MAKRKVFVSKGHTDIVLGWKEEDGEVLYVCNYAGRTHLFHQPILKKNAVEMELEKVND